jgi:hypothetical protein
MDRLLPLPTRLAPTRPSGPGPRLRAALAAAWHRLTMDADERFLRDAADLADLERRLKALEHRPGLPVSVIDALR